MKFIFYDSYVIIELISDFLLRQKLLKQGYHELVVCCTIFISPVLFWWDPWRSYFCLFFFLDSVSCDQCCSCLWMVYSWLPHRFSLVFIYSENAKFISFSNFLFLLMIFFRELFNAWGCACFRYWQRSKRNCKYRWPCVRNRQRITPFKLIHETLSRQTFKVSHQQNSTGC